MHDVGGISQKNGRPESLCPAADRCGGCVNPGIDYLSTLEVKRNRLQHLMKGLCQVNRVIGMKDPYHYRCKVNAAFAFRNGKTVSGRYAEGTHRIVQMDSCLIENQTADAIIKTIRDLIRSFKIRVYDEDTGVGFLRHVQVRIGRFTGQVMVVLVAASPVFPSRNHFVQALREAHPEITTIVLNINAADTSMVLGKRSITLYGPGYIEDTLCGKTFRISPDSFYQVNPVQTELLYTKAISLAGLTGKESVIDAYCGTGTIGIVAAGRAANVVGVELNENAVRDAVINAEINQVGNIRFEQGDAGEYMQRLAAEGGHADVVFMDPPRSGSSRQFLRALIKLAPSRIVYISCGPEALARDLQILKSAGYEVRQCQPFDLFAWTAHVETVVLMSRADK
ncbi:MAG: 23S rRNA (uracil(1939)-C(5))-methyltransferase RlmD [Lachnospiraceae bacterium]